MKLVILIITVFTFNSCGQDDITSTNTTPNKTYMFEQTYKIYQSYTSGKNTFDTLIYDGIRNTDSLNNIYLSAFSTQGSLLYKENLVYVCTGFKYEQSFMWTGEENYVSYWTTNNQYSTINSSYNQHTSSGSIALDYNRNYVIENYINLSN